VGKDFTAAQKQEIYKANKKYYKRGGIISDNDKSTVLAKYDSSQVPHVDHITAKSSGGSDYYFNARVISAEENIQKGGERGGAGGEEDYDAMELQMTLKQFIDHKRTGVFPDEILDVPTSPTSEEEAEERRKKRRRSSSGKPPAKRGRVSAGAGGRGGGRGGRGGRRSSGRGGRGGYRRKNS
jgi:hypothetical protein